MPPSALRGFAAEDQWRLRAVSDPQVSPDGRTVAFVVATPDRETDTRATAIWVVPADGSAPARPFTSGPEDSAPRWSPDGRALAFVAARGGEAQLHVAPLAGGEPVAVTGAPHGVSQPAWSPDGRRLAYVAKTGEGKAPEAGSALERSAPSVIAGLYHRYDGIGSFDGRRSHLFVVGVDDRRAGPRQLTDGDWDDRDPAWSPDGTMLAFVSDRSVTRHDEVRRDVWVVATDGRRRPRRLTRGRGTATAPRWSPDGQAVAYVGHEHAAGDTAASTHLLVVPAGRPGSGAGRGAPSSVSAGLDRTVWGLERAPGATHAWDPSGDSVLFIAADRGTLGIYRSPVRDPAPRPVLRGDRQLTAFDLAAGTLAFSSQWSSELPEIHVADPDGADERRVSDANGELRRTVRLAPTRRVTHRAVDGTEIESLLISPPGRPRRAPAVLEIHGGPHSWHPQVALLGLYQALAAAGYVVVLPNPRGSHGYGEAFARASVGDWGGADFEDVMGALGRLVDTGVADPDRLYVAGYSYGGYLTSWIVGHTDRFAAACVSAPVTDLASAWGTTDIPSFVAHETGGLPWERPDAYAERSPLTYLSRITTPVQLFHWAGDLRCPIGQSEQLFHGLRRLGREAVLVRYPGGFHIVRSPSQMVDFVRRHLDWFASHRRRSAKSGAPT